MTTHPVATPEVKLEPCPFCGGRALVEAWNKPGEVNIECENYSNDVTGSCPVAPRLVADSIEEGAAAWNTRPQPSAQRGEANRALSASPSHGGDREVIIERFAKFVSALKHAPISWETGVCCCGSPVEEHGFSSGHGAVDEGSYFVSNQIEDAEAFLAALKPEPLGERSEVTPNLTLREGA